MARKAALHYRFFSGVNGSNEEMDSIFFSQDVLALFISASCYDS